MDDHEQDKAAGTAERLPTSKRTYRPPQLTEYGSVSDLVDAGVVGSTGTVPSLTPQN